MWLRIHTLLKAKRHWTVYAVLFVLLITIGGLIHFLVKYRTLTRLEDSITEAGGVILYDRQVLFPDGNFEISILKPVEAEISSGSHPVPELLPMNRLPSIKTLSLNTNNADDHLVPMLIKLRHLEVLNLTRSEMSAEAVLQILDHVSNLKQLHLTEDNFDPAAMKKLKASPHSAKLIF